VQQLCTSVSVAQLDKTILYTFHRVVAFSSAVTFSSTFLV